MSSITVQRFLPLFLLADLLVIWIDSVCAAINPYNAPVACFLIKAAPCLATGNVLIVKPSEKSPLGSLAIAPLFEEAGFPKGVVQVLTGAGTTGALLSSHMRVRKVSCDRLGEGNPWYLTDRES